MSALNTPNNKTSLLNANWTAAANSQLREAAFDTETAALTTFSALLCASFRDCGAALCFGGAAVAGLLDGAYHLGKVKKIISHRLRVLHPAI